MPCMSTRHTSTGTRGAPKCGSRSMMRTTWHSKARHSPTYKHGIGASSDGKAGLSSPFSADER
eukprot:scaffold3683_cov118-Isochrysis_galbana.AAC.7